jgi:hypothetical protein
MQASRGNSEPRLGRPAGFYAVRNRRPFFSAAAMATFPSLMAAILRHVSMAARAKSRSIGADVPEGPRELIGRQVSARTFQLAPTRRRPVVRPRLSGGLGERQLIRSCLIRTVRSTKSRCRTISAGTRSLDFRRKPQRKRGSQKIGARTSASTRHRTLSSALSEEIDEFSRPSRPPAARQWRMASLAEASPAAAGVVAREVRGERGASRLEIG